MDPNLNTKIVKEVLNISLQKLDILKQIESKALISVKDSERNDFNFYNIHQEPNLFKKTKRKFNSIHYLTSTNITEQKKFFRRQKQLSTFENSIINQKPRELLLGDM